MAHEYSVTFNEEVRFSKSSTVDSVLVETQGEHGWDDGFVFTLQPEDVATLRAFLDPKR